jgi:hypothetical protein
MGPASDRLRAKQPLSGAASCGRHRFQQTERVAAQAEC